MAKEVQMCALDPDTLQNVILVCLYDGNNSLPHRGTGKINK